MSFVKISDLTEKTTLAGTEEVLINDSGTSKKMATQRFLDVQTAAEAAQTAAEAAQTAAETAETNAETAETNAAASESAAATSESNAATSESNAATSATNASNSASAAATSESNAAASESAAATSESNAAASESAAATSESNAATSESNAATSATNASNSASAAATSATNASNSASAAATSATNASNSASAASTSASNASSSATAAANAQSAAETARDQTLDAFDSFDDRYLGTKASDPSVDNDGNALVAGALYFNSTDGEMKVYDGSQWLAAYASLSGALLATNDLSDLNDAATARTNLGLGTAATTASTDYATAAQGSTADSALQNLIEDTTPQLGGTLDANGNSIDMGTYTITDASVGQWDSTSLTVGTKESNWDTAYGWGNHASAGYADGTNESNWDTAYSWGDHSTEGYLTGITGQSIENLSDVNTMTPSDGQLLTWDNTNSRWDAADAPVSLPDQTGNSGKYLTSNGTVASWDALATVANSGAYSDLSGTPTNVSTFTNDSGYITGNQTITLSGDATGSGTTSISVTVADDSHSHSTSTLTGLGTLATLNSVNAATITDNSVGAAELNVSGDGTTSQYLRSDGDGTFTWATPPDTNTTYSAGSGLSLSSTTFSHGNTSSQGSVNNSGSTFIQDITLDSFGHITGIASAAVSAGLSVSASSFGTNGYIKFSNNFTIQWGHYTTSQSLANILQSFPISFPNNCLAGVVSAREAARPANGAANEAFQRVSASQFRLGWWDYGSAIYRTVNWIAVGY